MEEGLGKKFPDIPLVYFSQSIATMLFQVGKQEGNQDL
jgi:hypothetical protein